MDPLALHISPRDKHRQAKKEIEGRIALAAERCQRLQQGSIGVHVEDTRRGKLSWDDGR
jgi:hypothetical protein